MNGPTVTVSHSKYRLLLFSDAQDPKLIANDLFCNPYHSGRKLSCTWLKGILMDPLELCQPQMSLHTSTRPTLRYHSLQFLCEMGHKNNFPFFFHYIQWKKFTFLHREQSTA